MPSPTGFRTVQQPIAQVSPESESKLAEFCDRTGYKIKQENGQRKYGGPPPNWSGSMPTRGCEVFVGKLPRDLFEDELIPLFSEVGDIFELRLMMDFSGTNRGYCFLTFAKKDQAKRACLELNNHEIRPGKHIGVMMSVDNCRLFVGGIPRDRKREEIKAEMEKLTEGVVDVILYPSANDKTKNRGFAFVEYVSHKAAAMARRNLVPKHVQLWGQPICVDWAEPEQDVDEETMANVKILYVRNLMLDTTEDAIRGLFESIKPGSVERVKKLKDYAFVHFYDRQDAFFAMQQTNGGFLEGAELEVVWAKPPDKSIMRYVKSVQKLGSQALPPGPSVHQSIVAAATAQMYAASSAPQNGFVTPSGTSSPPSPAAGIPDPISWAYTGYPFVDSGYAYQVAPHDPRLVNSRPVGNSGGRYNRGAAGMRAAGFQAFVNNQVRKNRRRQSEAALVYELSPFGGTVPTPCPVTPILAHPGMVLIPTLPPQLMAAHQPVTPVVSQAPVTLPPTPVVTTTPGGSPPAGGITTTCSTQKIYSEQLEDLCRRQEWGSPVFEPSTFVTKDVFGRDTPAFVCKATIPALASIFGVFAPQKYWPNPELAKEFCALHVLVQVGYTIDAGQDVSPVSPVFPAF